MTTAGGFWGPSSRLAPYFTKINTELQRHENIPKISRSHRQKESGKKTWPVSWCLSTKPEMSVDENTTVALFKPILMCVQYLVYSRHHEGCKDKTEVIAPGSQRHSEWLMFLWLFERVTLDFWTLWFSWWNKNSMFFWDRWRESVERCSYLVPTTHWARF